MYYASCKDIVGKREYLVAENEEEIQEYCGEKKELLHWYTNPTPIMVCHHFIWVGKGKRPPILSISKPFKYGSTGKEGKWTP